MSFPGALGPAVGFPGAGSRVSWDQIVPSIGMTTPATSPVTSDITLTPDISFVEVDTTSGAVTVTLAPLVDCYQVVTIVNTGTGVVTIDANGSETIVGSLTLVLSTQYDGPRLWPGSSEWLLG